MSDPLTVAVPVATLRQLLAKCRKGITPMVGWSDSKPLMDASAMRLRGEVLEEIEQTLEPLIRDVP